MEAALRRDLAGNGGVLPTLAEVDELVTGGDEGEASPELLARFPNLDAAIAEIYG